MKRNYEKILVLGAGPVVIGRSSEYDYAAVQVCRALRANGIQVVTVNSNPATMMTEKSVADIVYTEALDGETVKKIIVAERPDAIIGFTGGAVGMEICLELLQNGYLAENHTELIGMGGEVLRAIRTPQALRDALAEINEPFVKAEVFADLEDAITFADEITYPVSVSPAFTPETIAPIRCENTEDLKSNFDACAEKSLVSEVYVQKCVEDYKDIEWVLLRDAKGNCVHIASTENIDAVGIHTGDSIVTVPAQTLNEKEQAVLRASAEKIANALSIVGSCNVSFALNPKTGGYTVLSVEPELNRSTALVSKATGYPVAEVSAGLAIGQELSEIPNAAKEPIIDYCAVKMPKWSFEKFDATTRRLGREMQATGEVFATGKTFLDALLKAVRCANPEIHTLQLPKMQEKSDDELKTALTEVDDEHIFALYEAVRRKMPAEDIRALTGTDTYFLNQLKDVEVQNDCKVEPIAQNGKADARKKILVLGAGATTIGLGTDRDYAATQCLATLDKFGYSTVMVNSNPAAVSTDFHCADTLYIEPVAEQEVNAIAKQENIYGAILPFGGGNAVRKSEILRELGVEIFGADADMHRSLKNRIEFFDILDSLNIRHTQSRKALVGRGAEVDALCDGENALIPGIYEHIEKSQIASGDSVSVFPSTFTDAIKETITLYTEKLSKALKVKGLLNIHFVIYDNEVYVSSASVVSTRNVPFMSKATALPIIEIATRLMLGETLQDIGIGTGLYKEPKRFFVRVPVFSFDKMQGIDVQLGDDMKSTGEVIGVAETAPEAMLKALIASGIRIKRTGGVLISVANSDKADCVPLAGEFLKQGFKIYATSNTAKILNSNHVAANSVRKMHEGEPNTMTLILKNKLSYVVSTAEQGEKADADAVKIRRTALLRRIPVLPSVETAHAIANCLAENNAVEEIKVCKL